MHQVLRPNFLSAFFFCRLINNIQESIFQKKKVIKKSNTSKIITSLQIKFSTFSFVLRQISTLTLCFYNIFFSYDHKIIVKLFSNLFYLIGVYWFYYFVKFIFTLRFFLHISPNRGGKLSNQLERFTRKFFADLFEKVSWNK